MSGRNSTPGEKIIVTGTRVGASIVVARTSLESEGGYVVSRARAAAVTRAQIEPLGLELDEASLVLEEQADGDLTPMKGVPSRDLRLIYSGYAYPAGTIPK